MSELIIFDFDGTLADTFELAVTVVNDLALERGFRAIDPATIRTLGTREALTAAGVRLHQIPGLVIAARSRMARGMDEVAPFPGVVELIGELHAGGTRLAVISSNSEANVDSTLTRFGIRPCFETIVTGSSLFGKHRLIAALVKRAKVALAAARYVGDEARDVEACRKIGVPITPVTWGFHAEARLREVHDGPLARSVDDLRKLLTS